MLLAYRLVRLIEEHSDPLAKSLLLRVQHSRNASAYKLVPAEELRHARVRNLPPPGRLAPWQDRT